MKKLFSTMMLAVMLSSTLTVPVLAKPATSGGNIKATSGLNLNVSFKSDQKDLAYIPQFTLDLLSENGDKTLSTATANAANFDKTSCTYKLVFNIPEYKSGDNFGLVLDSKSDSVVSGLGYEGYTKNADGTVTSSAYTINSKSYVPVAISEVKYCTDGKMVSDPTTKVTTTLTGMADQPLTATLKTDASKSVILLQDEEGLPITNLPVEVQGTYTKEKVNYTSDSKGMIWLNESSIFPLFVLTPAKDGYKVVGNNAGVFEGSFPILTQGQTLSNFTSFKAVIHDTGLSNMNEGGVNVNISTNSNIDLSKNWTSIKLALTDKNGAKQIIPVSMKNNKIALADGVYSVSVAESKFSNVTVNTPKITVKNGKSEISLSMTPQYTMEVSKKDAKYSFSIINIPSVKDKVYTGSKITVFAVTPGESYMIQDKDTNKIMNVSILADSKITHVALGEGITYDSTSGVMHTGDNFFIILSLIIITSLALAVVGVKYRHQIKIIKDKKSLMSLLLICTMTASIISSARLIVHANTTGYPRAIPETPVKASKGYMVFQDNVSPNGIPGVLKIGFIPNTDECNLTENSTVADMASTSKFVNDEFMLYMAPTERASELWNNSGYIEKMGDGLYTRWGTSPFIADDTADPANTALRAPRTISCDPSSSNSFITTISSAVQGKTLCTDSESVGKSLSKVITGKYYNSSPNVQKDRDTFFNDYIELLRNAGAYGAAIDELNRLYKENKVTLLVQSLAGFHLKDASNTDYKTYGFMSTRDIVETIALVEGVAVKPNESERSIYNRLRPYDSFSDLSVKLGHFPFAAYRFVAPFMDALCPSSNKVSLDKATNPYAGWGYYHWLNDTATLLTKDPKLTADLSCTVVNANGTPTGEKFTIPVPGWTENDNRTFIDMYNKHKIVDLRTILGSMTISYNNKTYNLRPNSKTSVDFYDIADKEGLNKSTMTVAASAKPLNISLPNINDSTSWKLVIDKDTLPVAKDLHTYLGGPTNDGSTSVGWSDPDYAAWQQGNASNVAENKYKDKKDANGNPLSSDAKAIINATVVDGTPQNLKPEDYSVPEWRLSKYWDNISQTVQNTATFSLKLTPDAAGASIVSNLIPSGINYFDLVDPNLAGVPWAKSNAKWLGSWGSAYVTHDNPTAQLKVGGDLLATRLSSDSNIRFANWLINNGSLSGIDSSPLGKLLNTPSFMDKQFTFSYGILSPYDFIHNIGKMGTRTIQTGIDEDGNPVYGVEKYAYTVPETPSKSYTTANYDKTVRFNRYSSKPSSATSIKPSSGSSSGFYWENSQSTSTLNIDPEVLMAYSDSYGNDNVGFVAGDRLRQIKPTAYSSLKINATIKPNVNGTSVATDNKAKILAGNLGAGGKQVILKGSAVNTSFDIDGVATAKVYALDIQSPSKQVWNPGTSYSADKVNEAFLGKFATKNSNGSWTAKVDKEGKLKINGIEYGSNKATDNITATTTSTSYNLTIRGGKLVSINGVPLSAYSSDFKDVLEKLGLTGSSSILNVFEHGAGAILDEQNIADLASYVRGSSDIAVGKPWYTEDCTTLVIKEYTTTFNLPRAHMFSDKIPMNIPGIESPVDKNLFYTKGFAGHTALRLSLPLAKFDFDDSNSNIDYVIPNVSILDSTY